MSAPILMTTIEVMRLLGCCRATVRALSEAGVLPAIWTPKGTRYAADDAIRAWRRGRPFMGKWGGCK